MLRVLFATVVTTVLLLSGGAFASEKLPAAPEGSFSFVVIPDTQAYRGQGAKLTPESQAELANPIFESHVQWIAKNIGPQKIAFVSHVGDIVDKNVEEQWKIAQQCMDVVHGKVPYGISVGNHDMTSKGNSSLFQKYFPKSRFELFDWYGGCYEGSPNGTQFSGNNANSYQLFSAGGKNFIFVHLECNAPDDVLEWANGVLKKHSDRQAFITSHMGWGPKERPKTNDDFMNAPKGRMQWSKIHGERGNTPQQMWEKCYSKHPNLIAVFSGDQSRSQAIRATTAGVEGNMIHEFLNDYMQATREGGWLRLYRFFPNENKIQVYTFHPVTEVLCDGTNLVKDREQHQFEVKWAAR